MKNSSSTCQVTAYVVSLCEPSNNFCRFVLKFPVNQHILCKFQQIHVSLKLMNKILSKSVYTRTSQVTCTEYDCIVPPWPSWWYNQETCPLTNPLYLFLLRPTSISRIDKYQELISMTWLSPTPSDWREERKSLVTCRLQELSWGGDDRRG